MCIQCCKELNTHCRVEFSHSIPPFSQCNELSISNTATVSHWIVHAHAHTHFHKKKSCTCTPSCYCCLQKHTSASALQNLGQWLFLAQLLYNVHGCSLRVPSWSCGLVSKRVRGLGPSYFLDHLSLGYSRILRWHGDCNLELIKSINSMKWTRETKSNG